MGGRAGQRRVAEPEASHFGSYALFTGIQHHFPAVSHVCYQPYKHMGKDHVKQGRRVCAYTSIPGCYRTACVKSVHALHLYIC